VFVLGHAGIGTWLGNKLAPARDARWILLGTLLPDLIDKPLYYGLAFATGKRAAELGLISGTRTIGHTALFALFVLAAFWRRHGPEVALGMATHLALDSLGDVVGFFLPVGPPRAGPSTLAAVLFPLLGPRFPVSPFKTVGDHFWSTANGYHALAEALGTFLLYRLWRRGVFKRSSRPPSSPARPGPALPRGTG
jgi:hypothetical protein